MITFRRLLPYIRKHAIAFWAGMAAIFAARFFEAMIPMYVKEGIDGINDGQAAIGDGVTQLAQALDSLTAPVIGIVVCVIGQMTLTIGARILMRRIGMFTAYDLRNRLYQHLQRQGPAFFSDFSIGDLMARSINDIQLVRQILAYTIRMTFILLLTAVVGLVFMFSLSAELTLAILLPLPFIGGVAFFFSKRVYRESFAVQEGFSMLSTFVQENLNGIRTVQAMAQEPEETARFARINQHYTTINKRLFVTTSLLGSLMPTLSAGCMLIIIAYGSYLVQNGSITLGTLAAFFSYLTMVLWPVRDAGALVTQWQRGASGTSRVFEILDHEPEIRDQPTAAYPELTGEVEIQNLYYQYEGKDKYALENINLHVLPGETIAILGRIGSGKSTLLRLLARLLDPTRGEVLLNGYAIAEFPLAYLREQVCLVLQDPFLFADSLGDNITYDDPARGHDEIWESAEAAALAETIEGFNDGLHTLLGERGVTLSGGQKQRTALARGLIRMTPILILDDCFSAVDTETEEHILAGLKRIRAQETTLLVSHRVSTARHADRILVLEEGRIIEVGSHAELLEKGGFYADLEEAQRAMSRPVATVPAT